MSSDGRPARRIVLGVTAGMSLKLMRGFPQYLQQHGWDVHVVTSPGPELDALADSGITTWPLPMERDPSPSNDLRSLLAWVRLLRRLDPDLVSVGTPKAGFLGTLAARICRVPARVYLNRGLRLETSTGQLRTVLTGIERLSSHAATTVLAVSHTLRDRILELGLAPADRVQVVGAGSSNGVAVPDSLPERTYDHGVVGFVGRATIDKGIDLLADALVALATRGRTGTLLLVGPVEDERVESHLAEVAAAGWEVERTGAVPDPSPLYDRMDLLVLPTRREGFPNVVLEAAVRRVPCVATAATGVPDAIQDGVTGVIVGSREPAELANALSELLDDPARLTVMGRTARARASEKFSREVVWAAYEAFYRAQLHDSPLEVT